MNKMSAYDRFLGYLDYFKLIKACCWKFSEQAEMSNDDEVALDGLHSI
jgi:hypothetical protein